MKLFKSPKRLLGELEPETAAALIAAASDIALVTDRAGVIKGVAIQSDELATELEQQGGWTGRKWIDVVTAESRPKIEALLDQASQPGAAPRWRHVNYPSASGPDVPVLFSAIRLPQDGRVIGFGRDLRPVSDLQQRLIDAQQTMERDFARRQQMETRYRILFQISPDPVLIVNTISLRMAEVNPAAQQLLATGARRIEGRALTELFDEASTTDIQGLLTTARTSGRAEDVRARLANGGREMFLSAYLFRQDDEPYALVRLSPTEQNWPTVPAAQARVAQLIENFPDGFVVTAGSGEIVSANRAFLDLAQLTHEDQARGQLLERWLGRPSVDLNVLLATLRQRNVVKLFATTFRDGYGVTSDVEISATSTVQSEATFHGFCIRAVGQRLAGAPRPARAAAERAMPRSVEQLTELIGRVSLKDLVREATDMIERLCIEAAWETTNDNRALAAEIVGLSRQSLYVKLRRYGIGELGEEET